MDFQSYAVDQIGTTVTFRRHSNVRWLTLRTPLCTLKEHFNIFKRYFVDYLPNQRNFKSSKLYRNIKRTFCRKLIRAEIEIFVKATDIFQTALIDLQKSEPMIHVVFGYLSDILKELAGLSSDIEFEEEYLQNNPFELANRAHSVTIWPDLFPLLAGDNNRIAKYELKQLAAKAFAEAGSYLMNNVSLESYKQLTCLDPQNIQEDGSIHQIQELADMFPQPSTLVVDTVVEEYRRLSAEPVNWKAFVYQCNLNRVDDIWMEILRNRPYPQLTYFIKNMLCLSHGQADVERNFSKSGRYMKADKGRVNVQTLSGALHIVDAVRVAGNSIPAITGHLISVADQARITYNYSVSRIY